MCIYFQNLSLWDCEGKRLNNGDLEAAQKKKPKTPFHLPSQEGFSLVTGAKNLSRRGLVRDLGYPEILLHRIDL